jgi:hypothetical protein
MRKAFFLIITVATILSCKKENNRIGNETYQLDSVRVETLDANDSSIFNITFKIGASVLDSFLANNPYPGTMSIGFYKKDDSLNFIDRPEFIELKKFISINKKPISNLNFMPNGAYAQYGYYKQLDSYNYNTDGKLQNLYSLTDYHQEANFNDSDYVININTTLNYSNNILTSLNESSTFYNYHLFDDGYDSIVNANQQVGVLGYANHYLSQKEMIGLDVNDLILLELFLIKNYDYFNANNDVLGLSTRFFVLESALSFNTTTDQLIESINYSITKSFNRILYQSTVNLAIDYTFDTNHNNRISSMKIFNADSHFDAIKYTFYYKN